jgi:hypothetical protein
MFTASYTIQMPKGTMLFIITVACRQLNEEDEILSFNLTQACHVWWHSEESNTYKTTPHALCLGLWLALSKQLKETSDSLARDLIVESVKLDAPGLSTGFGVDK